MNIIYNTIISPVCCIAMTLSDYLLFKTVENVTGDTQSRVAASTLTWDRRTDIRKRNVALVLPLDIINFIIRMKFLSKQDILNLLSTDKNHRAIVQDHFWRKVPVDKLTTICEHDSGILMEHRTYGYDGPRDLISFFNEPNIRLCLNAVDALELHVCEYYQSYQSLLNYLADLCPNLTCLILANIMIKDDSTKIEFNMEKLKKLNLIKCKDPEGWMPSNFGIAFQFIGKSDKPIEFISESIGCNREPVNIEFSGELDCLSSLKLVHRFFATNPKKIKFLNDANNLASVEGNDSGAMDIEFCGSARKLESRPELKECSWMKFLGSSV